MDNAREALHALLSGTATASRVVEAVCEMDEGQWLDFKNGSELAKEKRDRNGDLERWATAFANAEGGLLIYGISDAKPRKLTGLPKVGGQSAAEWATRVLSNYVALWGRQPRIELATVEGGEVLLVGVDRSPNLIPIIESGEWRYYLRIGDSARLAPSYLQADLLLGRRQRPTLTVKATAERVYQGTGFLQLKWTVIVVNAGLVWVPRLMVAVVGFRSAKTTNAHSVEAPSDALLSTFRVQRWIGEKEGPVAVVQRHDQPLAPLEQRCSQFGFNLSGDGHRIWRGVVVAAPINGEPVRWQLDARFEVQPDDRGNESIDDGETGPVPFGAAPHVWHGEHRRYIDDMES